MTQIKEKIMKKDKKIKDKHSIAWKDITDSKREEEKEARLKLHLTALNVMKGLDELNKLNKLNF